MLSKDHVRAKESDSVEFGKTKCHNDKVRPESDTRALQQQQQANARQERCKRGRTSTNLRTCRIEESTLMRSGEEAKFILCPGYRLDPHAIPVQSQDT